jgi:MOSC domain-containing protein YiiM
MPREIASKIGSVLTGIFKEPVQGEVAVRRLNLDGDAQADLTAHGGVDKAVYAYPSEHYEYWRGEFPEKDMPFGMFGENLTTEGLLEDELHIGDRLRIGTAVLRVTQPRMPCYKLALKFQRDDIIKRFLASGKSGFYFSVEHEGSVGAGSPVEILSRDEHRVSIPDITRLYVSHEPDKELLQRAITVDALPQSWKDYLVRKSRTKAQAG